MRFFAFREALALGSRLRERRSRLLDSGLGTCSRRWPAMGAPSPYGRDTTIGGVRLVGLAGGRRHLGGGGYCAVVSGQPTLVGGSNECNARVPARRWRFSTRGTRPSDRRRRSGH